MSLKTLLLGVSATMVVAGPALGLDRLETEDWLAAITQIRAESAGVGATISALETKVNLAIVAPDSAGAALILRTSLQGARDAHGALAKDAIRDGAGACFELRRPHCLNEIRLLHGQLDENTRRLASVEALLDDLSAGRAIDRTALYRRYEAETDERQRVAAQTSAAALEDAWDGHPTYPVAQARAITNALVIELDHYVSTFMPGPETQLLDRLRARRDAIGPAWGLLDTGQSMADNYAALSELAGRRDPDDLPIAKAAVRTYDVISAMAQNERALLQWLKDVSGDILAAPPPAAKPVMAFQDLESDLAAIESKLVRRHMLLVDHIVAVRAHTALLFRGQK